MESFEAKLSPGAEYRSLIISAKTMSLKMDQVFYQLLDRTKLAFIPLKYYDSEPAW